MLLLPQKKEKKKKKESFSLPGGYMLHLYTDVAETSIT